MTPMQGGSCSPSSTHTTPSTVGRPRPNMPYGGAFRDAAPSAAGRGRGQRFRGSAVTVGHQHRLAWCVKVTSPRGAQCTGRGDWRRPRYDPDPGDGRRLFVSWWCVVRRHRTVQGRPREGGLPPAAQPQQERSGRVSGQWSARERSPCPCTTVQTATDVDAIGRSR